jgi:uncharacterized protein YecE (DUF72 family)
VFSVNTSLVTATGRTVARAYVGTSGFSYASWKPDFYPAGSKAKDFLRIYSRRLPSVELNTSFYQLPSEGQFRLWAEQTPDGFRFAVKMTRRITHLGRLGLVGTFCEQVRALGDRLGPVLIQFPPTRPRDDGLLELLLGSLDPDLPYAFEFRHPSWDGVDLGPHARVGSLEGDAPFRYLRLREPPYDEEGLGAWAERLRPLLESGIELYVYFKHEDAPDAPRYATRLLELLPSAILAG